MAKRARMFCLAGWIAVVGITAGAAPKNSTIEVRNAGIPGQNSSEGLDRFQRDVVEAHPQIVLIYFGMNDSINEPKMLSTDAYLENIGKMVEFARAANILPIVTTIQHVDTARVLQRHAASAYGPEGPNGRIDRFNAALGQFTAKHHVKLADFNSAFDATGGPTTARSTDGVHLTAAGYTLLAQTFLAALPQDLRKTTRIVAIGDSLTFGVPLRTMEHDSPQTYPAILQTLLRNRPRQLTSDDKLRVLKTPR